MATETLNPNAVGSTNSYSLSAGSGDAAKTALVNDGDDATYAYFIVTYTTDTGYGSDVLGIASANISKVNGIATANISKVNGV